MEILNETLTRHINQQRTDFAKNFSKNDDDVDNNNVKISNKQKIMKTLDTRFCLEFTCFDSTSGPIPYLRQLLYVDYDPIDSLKLTPLNDTQNTSCAITLYENTLKEKISALERRKRYENENFNSNSTTNSAKKFNDNDLIPVLDLDGEMSYVYSYLSGEKFDKKNIFASRRYDSLLHAIITFMLRWSIKNLIEFHALYSNRGREIGFLVGALVFAKCNGLTITHPVYSNYLVFPSIYKELAIFFEIRAKKYEKNMEPELEVFNLRKFLDDDFIQRLRRVYNLFLTEAWTESEYREFFDSASLEYLLQHDRIRTRRLNSPFGRYDDSDSGCQSRPKSRMKYITGVACCGKTTALNCLADRGRWIILNRGSMGSFGGKSKIPVHTASLHCAIDYVLSNYSRCVIGDRGTIDNPLWSMIMPLCNVEFKSNAVALLLDAIESSFNELVIGYYTQQDVVIYVDPYPSRTLERMLQRCKGGDAQRARIPLYAVAQCLAYYTFAELFGYPLVVVRYGQDGKFDVEANCRQVEALLEYFGQADSDCLARYNERVRDRISMPPETIPAFLLDHRYERLVGIYK